MKAAVWVDVNKIELREMEVPTPTAGEVLVKVTSCGVCGTDVHICSGEVPLAKPPNVLGHEICGEIVKTGQAVSGFAPGDFVCVDPVVGCGVCPSCAEGKTNLCPAPTIIGYARCGGFAQFTTVPATHLQHMRPGAGSAAGILAETLACVLNGYDRLELRAGSSVLIMGAGSVGLLWTSLVAHSLATRLIQAEPVAFRRETAARLGANVVVDSGKPGWQNEVNAAEPAGVDFIIDASGTAKAIQESLPLLAKGGTYMVFGVCPEDEKITVSPYEMFAKELRIIAAKMPPGTLARAVRILEAGLVDSDAIVTTTMPLASLPEAIGLFKSAKDRHIKIQIDPWA